jgi:hypothetical protein
LAVGLGLVGLFGCGTPNVAPELPGTPDPGKVFGGMQCSSVRPQTEPDLMGWDPGSRANLNRLRQDGVVAVRYVSEGCNVELEVLSNCIVPGKYAYQPYTESQSKTLKTERDLFAEIPISAARLSGQLKGNRQLRTDYELVGTASLPAGSVFKKSEIRGPKAECARATHVVSAVYLGGFAMVAGEESKLAAKVSVFGAGAGDEEGKSMDRIDKAGDAEACKEANQTRKENDGCRVPLRIGLSPLELDTAPVPVPEAPAVPAKVGAAGHFVIRARGVNAVEALIDDDNITSPQLSIARFQTPTDHALRGTAFGRSVDIAISEREANGSLVAGTLALTTEHRDGKIHISGLIGGAPSDFEINMKVLKGKIGQCLYDLDWTGKAYEGTRACGRSAEPVTVSVPTKLAKWSDPELGVCLGLLMGNPSE